jgi:hypothetical protein
MLALVIAAAALLVTPAATVPADFPELYASAVAEWAVEAAAVVAAAAPVVAVAEATEVVEAAAVVAAATA